MIYIGADHRGFELKEKIKEYLKANGHAFEDVGAMTHNLEDDFVDFGHEVGMRIKNSEDRGILLCRNGVGVDLVVNRFPHIRSVLGFDAEQVRLARNDDDVNVLSLPSEFIDEAKATELVEVFLATTFEGDERQMRRLEKIDALKI